MTLKPADAGFFIGPDPPWIEFIQLQSRHIQYPSAQYQLLDKWSLLFTRCQKENNLPP